MVVMPSWKPPQGAGGDNGENRNLALGVRNLKDVTLVATRNECLSAAGHQRVLLSEAAPEISEALREMNSTT